MAVCSVPDDTMVDILVASTKSVASKKDLRQICGVKRELVMSRYTRVGNASEAQTVIKT
jgi:hypothetical protein